MALKRSLSGRGGGCFVTGVNDVDDGRRPERLQVLDEGAGVSAVRVRCVHALGGKVVELLEVGVQHDLLFVRVLERLDPG